MLAKMPVLRAAIVNLEDPLQGAVELVKQPKHTHIDADIPENGQRLANVHMVKGLADVVDEGGAYAISCLPLGEP